MTMNERVPNPEQDRAIGFEGGNLLVSAAAGSGKTSTLTARVLRKILKSDNPIDIDRMLIVTFTRAAAAQMKDKISSALSKEKTPRASRQQILLPTAQICTIDAFGLWLIRQYGSAIGLPVNVSLSPEERVKLLEEEVLSAYIAEMFDSGNEDFLHFAGAVTEKDSSKLFETIQGLSNFLQPLPDPAFFLKQQLNKYDSTFYSEQAASAVREIISKIIETCHEFLPLSEKHQDYIRKMAEIAESALSMNYDELLDVQFENLPTNSKNPSKNPSAGLFSVLGRYKNKFSSVRKELITTPPVRLADESAAVKAHLTTLFNLTLGYLQKCAEVKKEREVFGYADITRFCADLLFTVDENGTPVPTELAKQVAGKFDEIMIDEFQDINELQFAIFTAISRGNNLFMVGDMKQSIYRFRNATPQVFHRVSKRSKSDGQSGTDVLIPLTKNYRSENAVIDAVNFVFSQLMREHSAEIEYDQDQYLVCRYDNAENMGLVKFCPVQADEDTENIVAEADVIAAEIRKLMRTGVQTADGLLIPKLSDFCILTSKNADCVRISDRLTRYGLDNYCMSEPGFFDLPEVKALLHVLWATDNPLNDLALLSAALSPVWHLSPDELGTIRAKYRNQPLFFSIECASRSGEGYAEKFAKLLSDLDLLRRYSAILPLGELISCAVELTGFEATAAAMGSDSKNIAQLIRYAADWDARGVDLSTFNALVADAVANGRSPESGGAIPAEAITICTIHKSKGLEFPVCFLAGTTGGFNLDPKTPDLAVDLDAGISAVIPTSGGEGRYKPLAFKVITGAYRQKTLAEQLRLLYVAMTRAKAALIITFAFKDPVKEIGEISQKADGADGSEIFANGKTFADWLIPALLHHPSCSALREAAETDFEIFDTKGTVQIEFATPGKAEQKPETAAVEAEPDPILVKTITDRLNYTYQYAPLTVLSSKYTVTELAEGKDDTELAIPRFLAGESGTSYGTEMHAFMQMCDFKAKDAQTEADRLYREGKLSRRALEMLNFDAVNRFLSSPLCAELTAEGVTIEREFDFISTIPLSKVTPNAGEFADQPVTLQGCADLVGVRSDGLILVDYKTDALNDSAQFLARYKTQLDLYADALSRIFNLPVLKKSIWSFKLGMEINIPCEL